MLPDYKILTLQFVVLSFYPIISFALMYGGHNMNYTNVSSFGYLIILIFDSSTVSSVR